MKSKLPKIVYVNQHIHQYDSFEPDEVLGKTLIYFKVKKADFSVIRKMLKSAK
jgi:hypothetical protein